MWWGHVGKMLELLGWRPWLLRVEAIAIRLEAIAKQINLTIHDSAETDGGPLRPMGRPDPFAAAIRGQVICLMWIWSKRPMGS